MLAGPARAAGSAGQPQRTPFNIIRARRAILGWLGGVVGRKSSLLLGVAAGLIAGRLKGALRESSA